MGLSKKAGVYVALLGLLGVLVIAGCGGGSSSSSSSGESEPAASESSGGESASGEESSEEGESGGGGSVMAKAEAEFEKFQTPVGLEGLPKIEKAIPAGKKVTFITCAPAACAPPGKYFEESANILEWKTKVVNAGETPSSEQEAMQNTVNEKPDAVVIEGLDPSVVSNQVEELKKEGVTVVLWQIAGVEDELPTLYTIPGPSHYEEITKAMAAAAVVAGGEEAIIGHMTVPAFPIYKETIDPEFNKAVENLCPKCKVEEYEIPISALGKNATTLITNFVRGHNGMNVVVNDQDVTGLGLDAALKGAGVTDVKIIGLYPTEANYPDLEAETEFALLPDPYHEIAALSADSLARIYTGGTPEPDIKTTAPVVIWTKENLPEYSPGQEPPVVENWEEKFKEIWGK
jgi:ribose transport system substrate-binding protein